MATFDTMPPPAYPYSPMSHPAYAFKSTKKRDWNELNREYGDHPHHSHDAQQQQAFGELGRPAKRFKHGTDANVGGGQAASRSHSLSNDFVVGVDGGRDDDENTGGKTRQFQAHDTQFLRGGKKQRQEHSTQQRKQKRKRVLQQNHENFVRHQRMQQPSYWQFDCMPPQPPPNAGVEDDTQFDSDESMFDQQQFEHDMPPHYAHDTHSTHFFDAQTAAQHQHQQQQQQQQQHHRYSHIPNTCPAQAKYRSFTEPPPQPQPPPARADPAAPAPPPPPCSAGTVPPSSPAHHHAAQNLHSHSYAHPRPHDPSIDRVEQDNDGDDHDHDDGDGDAADTCDNNNNNNNNNDDGDGVDAAVNDVMSTQQQQQRRQQQQRQAEEDRTTQTRQARQKQQQHELAMKTAQRLEQLRQEQRKQKDEEQRRNELRDRIHPEIIRQAHPFKNNPIILIKKFCPKVRLSANASFKDIVKGFKRALAQYHPDRTVNETLEQQIRAEEIFKLLSTEKEKFEKQNETRNNHNNQHHHHHAHNSTHQHHQTYHRQSSHRHARHGWF